MTVLRTNTIAGIGTNGPVFDGDLEFNSQNYVILPKGTSAQEGVLRTTVDVVGAGSTYYDNLVLAMPFNAATGLTDVSSRNRNPGAYGNVAISTAQSKYYGSSAYFDGSGDHISIASNEDFAFGTGAYTVEFWINFTTLGGQEIIKTSPSGVFTTGGFTIYYASGTISITSIGGAGSMDYTWSSATTNRWYHFAVCRNSSSNQTLYIDGVSVVNSTSATNNFIQDGFCIGDGFSADFNGYLQDLRIYKGLAKYTANFTPPERIAEIGVGFKAGQLRYNTDSNKVELYDGSQWTEVQSSRPDLDGGARGVFGGGGIAPVFSNVIDYVNIASTGNALDFGDLSSAREQRGTVSSSTRGLFAGGEPSSNAIDFITISSTGNALDFGDLTVARYGPGGVSSQTRGVFAGGWDGTATNLIDYVTTSSTGNAVDYGDLTIGRRYPGGGVNSPTRGLFAGGNTGSVSTNTNTIDFITISTLGNAQDFGDLIQNTHSSPGCSNSTRGIYSTNIISWSPTFSGSNVINYVTIATLGNAVDYGDLTVSRGFGSSCSSPIRGVFAGGIIGPDSSFTQYNIIDYVTILTQGNAVDFGDLSVARSSPSACSNAHGGL